MPLGVKAHHSFAISSKSHSGKANVGHMERSY